MEIRRFIHFKNTAVCGIVGILIVVSSFFLDQDPFDYLLSMLSYLEHFEVDEIILGGGVLLVGLVVDLLLLRREKERAMELQEQKVRVLKSTMRTVQDIVNNFLNNLVFFRLEAEAKGALAEGSLQAMDSLIQETSAKLNALGELDSTPEKPMAGGLTGIDYERNRSSRPD